MRWPLILLVLALACDSDNPGPGDEAVLVAASEDHDFGSIAVGQQTSSVVLTFSNGGDGESAALSVFVEGPSADELFVSADACEGRELGPEESCDVTVALRPSFAGPKEAVLRVAGRSQETASTTSRAMAGGTTMSASPEGLEFGDVRLSTASPTRAILIRNASPRPTGPLTVEIVGTHAADFAVILDACAGASLAGGFSCGISVRFQPSASGDRTAVLRVLNNEGLTALASLRGTGGTPTFLALSPSEHGFGIVRISQGTAVTFTVRNDGPGSSGVMLAQITGVNANNFRFELNSCAGQTLAPGASCTISTRFQPITIGPKTAELSVSSVYAEAVRATLTGEGAALSMIASPQAIAFVTMALGTSDAQTVTITNNGTLTTAPLRTALVDLTDYYYYYYYSDPPGPPQFEMVTDACTSVALAPGASCSLSIRYAPRTMGSHSGRLLLYGDASQSATRTVEIAGTAHGIRPTANALDFPPTLAGATSAAFSVGFFNTGSTPTGPLSTSLDGDAFTIVSDDCTGAALAGGAACTISVRFSPPAAGLHSGQITVSGSPGGGTFTSLRGQGM
jgi:hypothetical protein